MGPIFITYSPVISCLIDNDGEILQLYHELDDEFVQSIGEMVDDNRIITDSKEVETILDENEISVTIDLTHPILKDWRINRFENVLNKTGMVSSYEDYRMKIRQKAMKETFERIKRHSGKKDELISQVVHSIDDLQKTINLSGNRLSELYALHFPELVDSISNQVTLARVVASQPQRKLMTREQFETISLPKAKIDHIIDSIDHSMGGDLEAEDLVAMQEYAKSIIHTTERKLELEKWIDNRMQNIAPNLTAVAGANVGARLMASFGSLRDLAFSHSSKVQIVGAEKSLYSALRGRGNPPKHGIIYQIPEIGNSPYWIRGKLARAFASKIVIAARLDFFDGDFLGEKMRKELKNMEQELREQYPNEPKDEGGN